MEGMEVDGRSAATGRTCTRRGGSAAGKSSVRLCRRQRAPRGPQRQNGLRDRERKMPCLERGTEPFKAGCAINTHWELGPALRTFVRLDSLRIQDLLISMKRFVIRIFLCLWGIHLLISNYSSKLFPCFIMV